MKCLAAYTGPYPTTGQVGYINISEVDGKIRFTVRMEGLYTPGEFYDVPRDIAYKVIKKVYHTLTADDCQDWETVKV